MKSEGSADESTPSNMPVISLEQEETTDGTLERKENISENDRNEANQEGEALTNDKKQEFRRAKSIREKTKWLRTMATP